MSRKEQEQFKQDRLGNVNREFDEERGLDGMDATEDGNGNPNGLLDILAGDTGTDTAVYVIPDDADAFHLEEIHVSNHTGTDGTFQILSATLNDDGTVNTSTARSVTFNIATGSSRTISYAGKEFDGDAVAVNADFAGIVGVGGYSDMPEEKEAATEITTAPS